MNIALWMIQGLLAATFAGSGAAKTVMSKERMIASGQTGVAPFPLPIIRIVAALEILGAVGLIVPWLTDTLRVLTPLATLGLGIFMIGAAMSHWKIGEYKQVFGVNLFLLGLLAFVGVGRAMQL